MDAESLENLYYGIAAIVVAILTYHGWRQGAGRQAITLIAIASAYAVGFFGSDLVEPWFEFLRYPPQLTRIIAGAAAGLLTLIAITTVGRIFFKRTADRAPGKGKFAYGFVGALLGLVFGGIVFMVTTELVRLVGAVAQSNVQAAEEMKTATGETVPPANSMVSGIARLSTALNDGGSGTFFRKVDPVPTHVFATLTKLGIMVSRPEAVDRFLAYPGILDLTHHPKIVALSSDPEVSQLLASQSYFRLLRNEKVVGLASDKDFAERLRSTDFEKALDHALKTPPRAVKEPRWEPTQPRQD
jgi:uncharacterized membrane protein required for colicin V production